MNISMTCTELTKLREKAPVLFRGDLDECFSRIKSIGYDGASPIQPAQPTAPPSSGTNLPQSMTHS